MYIDFAADIYFSVNLQSWRRNHIFGTDWCRISLCKRVETAAAAAFVDILYFLTAEPFCQSVKVRNFSYLRRAYQYRPGSILP